MNQIDKYRRELYERGYCVFKNILDTENIKNLSETIELIYKNTNEEKIVELSPFTETWNFITNKKLINTLESLLNEKVYYMDGSISHYKENKEYRELNKNYNSWHRDTDSAPKLKDKVPYCKNNEFYKVFTVISYFNEKPEEKHQ